MPSCIDSLVCSAGAPSSTPSMSSLSAVVAAMSPGSSNILYHKITFPINVRSVTDSQLLLMRVSFQVLSRPTLPTAYSAYDVADFLLALDENSPLRIYALPD